MDRAGSGAGKAAFKGRASPHLPKAGRYGPPLHRQTWATRPLHRQTWATRHASWADLGTRPLELCLPTSSPHLPKPGRYGPPLHRQTWATRPTRPGPPAEALAHLDAAYLRKLLHSNPGLLCSSHLGETCPPSTPCEAWPSYVSREGDVSFWRSSWDAIKGRCSELAKVAALDEIGLKRLQRTEGITALRSAVNL
jgi:hypothetical protein